MFAALLALSLGGVWLWGLTALIFIIAVFSVERERFAITTPIVLGGIAVLVWLSHYPLFAMLRDHWTYAIYGVLGYFVLGVLYGFIRYWVYAHKISDKLDTWLHTRGLNREALLLEDAVRFAASVGIEAFPLRVGDSKQRIIFWMCYWPVSMPWTLVNEPVKRFFNFAYGRMAKTLQAIADRVFNDVKIVEKKVEEEVTTEKQKLFG